MSKASNSVLALCRAFYGKRITDKTYNELVACRSLGELLSSMRAKTVYAPFMEGAVADSASIEDAANKFVFDRFMSICHYEMAIGNGFYDYFITRIEIDEILKATLCMFGRNKGEYLISFSTFVDRHVSIDLFELGKANSFEGILASLRGSEYEKLYARLISDPEKTYLKFEEAFEQYFDEYILNLCKKCYKGQERKEVLEIIKMQHDLDLISRQERICKYYPSLLLQDTSKMPVPELTLLTPKAYHDVRLASNLQEIEEALSGTPYKKSAGSDDLETSLYGELFRKCKKQIRFSSNPGTVVYCYLFLAENEKRNIVHITEGIKYSLPPEEIKGGLIYEN